MVFSLSSSLNRVSKRGRSSARSRSSISRYPPSASRRRVQLRRLGGELGGEVLHLADDVPGRAARSASPSASISPCSDLAHARGLARRSRLLTGRRGNASASASKAAMRPATPRRHVADASGELLDELVVLAPCVVDARRDAAACAAARRRLASAAASVPALWPRPAVPASSASWSRRRSAAALLGLLQLADLAGDRPPVESGGNSVNSSSRVSACAASVDSCALGRGRQRHAGLADLPLHLADRGDERGDLRLVRPAEHVAAAVVDAEPVVLLVALAWRLDLPGEGDRARVADGTAPGCRSRRGRRGAPARRSSHAASGPGRSSG